jgi:hypothetical protein
MYGIGLRVTRTKSIVLAGFHPSPTTAENGRGLFALRTGKPDGESLVRFEVEIDLCTFLTGRMLVIPICYRGN